jgi:hypothetical protein
VKGTLPLKTFRLLLLATLLAALAIPAMAQVNDTYVIPGVANARGGFGSNWMTRFSLFNPQLDYPLVVSVTFLPTGGAPGIEELIEVPPNSLAYSDNILFDLYGITNRTGALLVAAFPEDNPDVPDDVLARSFLVTTNTFNNVTGGTYGQTVPGTWTGLMDYEYDGISSIAHGIRNKGKWRTNVGAANLGRCVVTVRVVVYDADGNKVREAPFLVPPLAHMQESLPVQISNGSVEFLVSDPCAEDDDLYAVVFPYTSTLDSESNDPEYQYPTLLASPGILYAKPGKIDPHAFGKKIDTSYARNVRSNVERRGLANLKRTDKGWQITQ